MSKLDVTRILTKGGQEGVDALSSATPVDSGFTSESWDFKVEQKGGSHAIIWTNSHIEDGVPIAIILQFGHGTGTGGYVQGQDYINPALRPVFDKIADSVRKAVKSV